MNIKLKSLSVELIFLSVKTESVHLRVRRVLMPDYRRFHFTAESDAGGHVHAHGTQHILAKSQKCYVHPTHACDSS